VDMITVLRMGLKGVKAVGRGFTIVFWIVWVALFLIIVRLLSNRKKKKKIILSARKIF